jgi:hypothetical protein
VLYVADGDWNDQTTWNTRPAIGRVIGTVDSLVRNAWVDVDVTQALRPDGSLSIIVKSVSAHDVEFAAREHLGYGPLLRIQ